MENNANDIKNGYAILNGSKVQFSERCIIEDKLYITIPSDFEALPSKVFEMEFPDEKIPDIILADKKETTAMLFSFSEKKIQADGVENAINVMIKGIREINPSFKTITTSTIDTEEVRIGYFDYVGIDNETADNNEEFYNLMFIFPLDGHLVSGSFSYFRENFGEWLEVSKQMICSIRIVAKNNKD